MRFDPAAFIGSIPEFYDSGLGPVIFSDYAADLARRVAAAGPAAVLETAAGTGILSRVLRDTIPAAASLVATDLNPPMLAFAQRKFAEGEAVEIRPADAQNLPFADQSFDAAVCQFGVMFYPDKDRAYRETLRVLRPGGRTWFSVWDGHRRNPFAEITHALVTRLMPVDPPQFYTVPFGYRFEAAKESLIDAGFDEIPAEVVRIQKRVDDLHAFVGGLVWGNPLVIELQARAVDPRRVFDALVGELSAAFGDPAVMPLQILVISARRPA